MGPGARLLRKRPEPSARPHLERQRQGLRHIRVGEGGGRCLTRKGGVLGEGCLNGQTLRLATVEAMTECVITRLDKAAIVTNRIHQVQRRLGSSQGKPPAKNRALDDTKDEADRNPPKVKFVYVLIAGDHCRDGLQGLMDADKVVVHGVKRDRSRVVLDFL